MKKSDFIISLAKNLDDYNEIDVSLSADIIQNAIIEALKKKKRASNYPDKNRKKSNEHEGKRNDRRAM